MIDSQTQDGREFIGAHKVQRFQRPMFGTAHPSKCLALFPEGCTTDPSMTVDSWHCDAVAYMVAPDTTIFIAVGERFLVGIQSAFNERAINLIYVILFYPSKYWINA
jgi:hypothetical protein